MGVIDQHCREVGQHARQPVGWNLFAPEKHPDGLAGAGVGRKRELAVLYKNDFE
jgi:hypothetical protein